MHTKNTNKNDNATLFIDASAEFVHGGNKNKLSDDNRKRILKAFTERKDEDHFCQLVQNGDIAISSIDKAKAEFKKYQVKTLSPVEKDYLENIKTIQKKIGRKKDKNE